MSVNLQNNVLITQDGRACLGEFGIIGAFERFDFYMYELETVRYMAPECFYLKGAYGSPETSGPSKESDVYSLAVTSFSVRHGPSFVIHPAT